MINGLTITKLEEIADHRGSVMSVIRSDSKDFTKFGECYCSEILPGIVKAWKMHIKQSQNFTVAIGKIKFVAYDSRENSTTIGKVFQIELSRPNHYYRIHVPPKIWYGFQCISDSSALIVNCPDNLHDPRDSQNLDCMNSVIPYNKWDK